MRKATTLNANNSYAFYVLGVMLVTNRSKGEAVAALQRAVALKPQDLSYRKALNRARALSVGEIAVYKATRACSSIRDGGIKAWIILANAWKIVRLPWLIFLSIYRGVVFRLSGLPRHY
jgi:predicted Zn-dependent protease